MKPQVEKTAPRSVELASQGIETAQDFSNVMSALMSDILSGKITPGVGNAAVNAGGKLLKAAELQAKYGTDGSNGKRVLRLAEAAPQK